MIQSLLKLQALEFGDVTGKGIASQIAELRAQIPSPVLAHYDRLRVRGKKGVAIVRNHVCTGCHMQQPIGKITILMRDEDVQLCDSCGRYLYLPGPAESELVERMASAKPSGSEQAPAKPAPRPAPKPRKRKEPKALAKALATA